MGELRGESEAAFVSSLYEHALEGDPETFFRQSLTRLAESTEADSAVWIIAQAQSREICSAVLHTSSQVHCIALPPAEVPADLATFLPAEPGAALTVLDLAQKEGAEPDLPCLRAWGVRHLVAGAMRHAGTLFSSVVSLHRKAAGAAFSAGQRRLFETCLPHAVKAGQLALLAYLKLDTQLQKAGRVSRGAGCICDGTGAVLAVTPEFAAAVRQRFASWDGLRLPFDLPATAATKALPRDSVTVRGLHLRTELRGALTVVYLRAAHPFDELSRREREIVRAIVSGQSYKMLARRIGVSPSTVANHAANIYRKLGVYNRDDVLEMAKQRAGTPKT